jgi:nitroimidazol reductase NimA-like FMN-containing flavoprotein (pyridoxamine 5'-phosphate oxidase superfamily)
MSTDTTRPVATGHLTPEDRDFLARPLHGFLSVAAGALPPQPRPVWFEATAEGTIQSFTGPDSVRVRRLRRDPRASIVVAAPTGERERWVSVAGRATVETDGAHDLAARLAARYWDLEDPVRAGQLAEILADDWVRVVLEPDDVRRFAF